MKKVLVTIAIAMASMVAANAQFSIGGDFGFNYQSNEGDSHTATVLNKTVGYTGDKISQFGIAIDPKIGYDLDSKMTLGAYLGIGYLSGTAEQAVGDDTEYSALNWNFTPFLRYNCAKFGKFGVAAELQIGVNGTNYTVDPGNNADKYEPSTFAFGANVVPFLTYDLSSNWTLETKLNFLSLGVNYSKTDWDGAADDTKVTKAGLGVDANNIVNIGAITVGATYKF